MFKRSREDGQISREDYEKYENSSSNFNLNAGQTPFRRASAETMVSRKIVSVTRNSRKDQFIRHMKALNTLFLEWAKSIEDKSVSLVEGCEDYISYCEDLQQRYLKTYGEVLTFGSGDCGQLAHGIEEESDLMVKYPRIVYSLRDKKVCGIACGGLHNAIYTETGQVYTWGCADDGSLGRIGEEAIPILVEDLSNQIIIGVACGDGQTLALSSTGEVYGWGCYKDKEGNKWFNPDISKYSTDLWKDIKKQQNTPQLISGLSNIVELACGSSFNLARSDDGQVYSWGIGECGELGRDVVEIKAGRGSGEEKTLLPILNTHITPGLMYIQSVPHGSDREKKALSSIAISNVKTIGCGSYHAMIVIVGGTLYSTGLNNYSQLGLGDTEHRSLLNEVRAVSNYSIVSIKGGMHHSLALTSEGTVLAWGRSDYCQLGTNATDAALSAAGSYSSIPITTIIPSDIVVKEIACGGNHNLALAYNRKDIEHSKEDAIPMVYTWGYGDMLALGHGKDNDEPIPKKIDFAKGAKIPNIKVTQVAGGGQHSAIIGQVISTSS